jgi:tetratricopeptide (TPR) repeat protein
VSSTELEQGYRLLQANQLAAAEEACTRHLAAEPQDARALHLLGLVRLRAGNAAQSILLLARAASIEPSNVQLALSLGSACRAARDLDGAAAAFERAASLDPASSAARFNLGLIRRDAGRHREAALEFRAAARLDPLDYDAVQNLVDTLARAVRGGETPFVPAARELPQGAAEAVSIVVCSIDDARLERFRANMESHLRDRAHELVVIRDARSLCEGYARGLDRARHDIVVFCHDDVELVSADPFARIEEALQASDLIGFAGSSLAGVWTGHPHLHGWITHPAPDGEWEVAVTSLAGGVVAGMQTLDGVFMAMRRETAQRIGFDSRTFDGFHLYDLDFSYRAFRAGLRLAVTTEVVAVHASRGRFDAVWRGYAQRFEEKFPETAGRKSAGHWYGARFRDLGLVRSFYAQMRELGQVP